MNWYNAFIINDIVYQQDIEALDKKNDALARQLNTKYTDTI